MATAPRKSVVDLAYEINAAAERRAGRIKKAYAPAPPAAQKPTTRKEPHGKRN